MRPLTVFALLSGATLFACSVAGDDPGSQEADHTAGDPTYAQNEWLWANETETEFKENSTANMMMGEVPVYLPMDHPMTLRLQYWMDRLDEQLRAAHPDELTGVPQPKVIIQRSDILNAWVSCVPVTWDVPVRLEGAPAVAFSVDASAPDADADADAGVANADAGLPNASQMMLVSTGQLFAEGYVSLPRPHDEKKLGELVKFVNDGYAKCQARLDQGTLVFGEGCMRGDPSMASTAPKLQYCATGKYITFTSAYLLASLEEDRIIATMAHEMGHFYRSHVNMPSDVVNYFYALDKMHAHKPEPDPRTIEHTAKVRAKLRGEIAFTDWNEENALMKERGLGFYTTEQEADELGLELMAKIGVPPSVSISDILGFLKLYPEAQVGGVDYAECSAMREAGFRNENDEVVSPPVGDPSYAHHNACFRVFNMQREINAHRYVLGARPTPPGEDWTRLFAAFATEMNPPAPPPPPPPAPTDAGTD